MSVLDCPLRAKWHLVQNSDVSFSIVAAPHTRKSLGAASPDLHGTNPSDDSDNTDSLACLQSYTVASRMDWCKPEQFNRTKWKVWHNLIFGQWTVVILMSTARNVHESSFLTLTALNSLMFLLKMHTPFGPSSHWGVKVDKRHTASEQPAWMFMPNYFFVLFPHCIKWIQVFAFMFGT